MTNKPVDSMNRSELKALEILLRAPPREDRKGGHQATLDRACKLSVQGRKEAQ